MKNSWKNIIISSLALVGLVLAVYWNHFDNAFHFDDSHAIQNNAAIKDIALWKTYFTDAATHSSLPTNQGYRPLLTLSFALDYWCAGNKLDVFYFHLSTFVWFILQGILMFFLFLHLLDKSAPNALNRWAALFAVGFYCVNTVNAETINYISARSDVLSSVPVVAGMLIFAATTGWKRHLGLLPVAIGILVKPTAAMYLPIMLAYVVLFDLKLSIRELLKPKHWKSIMKWAIPAMVVCFGLFLLTQKMTPETWVPGGNSRFLYAITQPFVILRYFSIFIFPFGLSADSDWKPLESISDPRFVFGMLFLALLVLIIFRTSEKQQNRPIAFGLLWFLFALIPTSSFIPLSEVTNDHRVFFPYVGLVLAITWPLARWILHQSTVNPNQIGWIRAITLIGILCLFSAHSFGVVQRNKVWKTDESLWHDVTIKSPKNGRGLMNYGLSQMRIGNYQKALRYYLMALKTDYRNHPYLYVNMATTYDALGETKNVEPLYQDAVKIGWNYPDCHYYYAKWLLKSNRPSEAEYYAKEALRISPGHEYAKGMLGLMNAQVGTLLDQAKLMVQQAPTSENYINLSLHYYRNNQFEECIKACEMALELRPNNADAYNNICSAYNAMGRWKEGIAACEKALAISPDYTLARNNLKWAKTEMAKKAQ